MQQLKSGPGSLSKINEDEEHNGQDEAAPEPREDGSKGGKAKDDQEQQEDEDKDGDEIPWWFQPFYLQLFSVAGLVVLFASVAVGFHVTLQVKSGQCALELGTGGGLESARVYAKGTHYLDPFSGPSGLTVFDTSKQGGALGNRKYEFFGNLSMGTCATCDSKYRADRLVHGYVRVFSPCPALLYQRAAAPADNFSYAFTSIVLRELQRVGEGTPPEGFDPGNRNLQLQKITALLATGSMGKVNSLAEKLGLVVAGTDIKLEQLRV